MVTGLVRQLLYLASSWGLPLLVACQDVQTAFDTMRHSDIASTLCNRGVKAYLVAGMMRELTGLHAFMSLPAAGVTRPFDYSKGGKQGGVETPDQWNAVMDNMLEPLVVSWSMRKMGFCLQPDGKDAIYFSHAVWADNIVLFAASLSMMQTMVHELTLSVTSRGFDWKASSLEVLPSGSLAELTPISLLDVEGGRPYKLVSKLHLGGTCLIMSAHLS